MSWSISLPPTHQTALPEALRTLSLPFNDDIRDALDEASVGPSARQLQWQQLQAAWKSAWYLVSQGVLGESDEDYYVGVTLSGHANPARTHDTQWANDQLHIGLYRYNTLPLIAELDTATGAIELSASGRLEAIPAAPDTQEPSVEDEDELPDPASASAD